jgi:phosphatidylinositol alpha-mannosyltransferase
MRVLGTIAAHVTRRRWSQCWRARANRATLRAVADRETVPLRIALVCPYSVSVPGGVQNQVLGLARELRTMGHDVTVVAPVDGAAPPGVRSVGCSVRLGTNGSIAPVAPYPAAVWRALRTVRHGGFDVVHLHEPFSPSITIPLLLAAPRPIVGTFHAAGDQRAYRVLGRTVLRRAARRLDRRVAVSEIAAAPARRYLGGSYDVLCNGIDRSRYSGPPMASNRLPAVLFLGRDEPRKGLDVLLGALALLPPEVTLWVAGPGTDTGRARRRHGDDPRVRWLGALTEDEKVARLRSASVVCVPSLRAESFGVVLLEAMSAGAPIVASDLPAYRAVTDGGRAAQLTAPGDPAAIAASVRRLLDDAAVAGACRTAGFAAVERYSMRALAERHVSIYEEVTGRRP